MDNSKITTEDAPQYQKDLKNFVDSMTEDDWHGDKPIEEKWIKDFVDSME